MSGGNSIIIGVPSKGRLMKAAGELFARAGFALVKDGDSRGYRGRLDGLDGVEVAFLSASEIAFRLRDGEIHLGLTGEDLLREHIRAFDDTVEIVHRFGFGHADVVVAVPEAWLDVSNMAALEEIGIAFHARHHRFLRVATKYLNLTRDFFVANGVSSYRIVESLGATEGAPAAGTAEIVVDITSTGNTLRANHLKVLDDGLILKSEAVLARALTSTLPAGDSDLVARIGDGLVSAARTAT